MKQSNPYIILHTKWTSIFVSSIKFLQLNGYDLLATVRHFFIQTFFFRFFSPQIARPSINYITIETRNWKFHNFVENYDVFVKPMQSESICNRYSFQVD